VSELNQTGKIKFFNETIEYGFIITPNGEEVFVHATKLNDRVGTGDEVTFEMKRTSKGFKANNVSKVK